ncbi:MAG: SPOR domain-containing protein [Hydrogenophaga sp.]|uniref:SPOR domain-containing protein n=1 Tax=Hydrogenophaga sp. TaxID=1904254 RepID=UPI001E07F2B1|nr:SPOR domain-containing protein [Hydrogenophaga sp.]MBX3611159.1 SPOR domain-containing protein [Hydrogenophaga sp.]
MAETSAPSVLPDATAPAPAMAAAASATEALYRAALGPGRLAHYLPAFARFDELGMARPHWNHAAGWLGWHWLLYRRLWRQAIWHAVLVMVALVTWWWLHEQFGPWPAGVRWGLLSAIAVVAVVAPGWWGDAWLHADTRRRMTVAVRRARTVQEACNLLAAPTLSRRAWWLVLALELALAWGAWHTLRGSVPVAVATPEPVLSESAPGPGSPKEGAATPSAPAATPSSPAAEAAPPVPDAAPVAAPVAEPAAEPSPKALPVEAAAATAVEPKRAPGEAPKAVTPPPMAEAPSPPPILAPKAPETMAAATPAAPAAAMAPASPPAAPAATDAPRHRFDGHGVAVGIFADPANAQRAAERLRAAGLPVVTDPLESSRGPLTRVRVGPFDSHAQAVEAAARVKAMGLEARVFGPP